MGPGKSNWKHTNFAIFLAQMVNKKVYCPYRERSPVLRHHMIYCSLNTCLILLKTWFHGSLFFVVEVPFRRKGAVRCRYNAVDFLQHTHKQRVLMHGHQGWNVRHGLCHIYMIYVYIWVVYSFCLFCCLFIIVTTQFVALYKPCKPKPKPSTYDPLPMSHYFSWM